MTTGRINQVTIVDSGCRAHRYGLGEAESLQGGEANAMRGAPNRQLLGAMLRQVAAGHPIAPTEFPKGWSAMRDRSGASTFAGHDMHPSRGGYLLLVTPEGGYRAWAYPRVSCENVRHRPAIHRLHPHRRASPPGFRCLQPH